MRDLWTGAGLEAIETREITVSRTFTDFEDFWSTAITGPSTGPTIAAMPAGDLASLKDCMQSRLPADAAGHITYSASANAIKGRVPT